MIAKFLPILPQFLDSKDETAARSVPGKVLKLLEDFPYS